MEKQNSPSNQLNETITITEENELLKFIITHFPHKKRPILKSILSGGQIKVNNQPTTQFNHPLKKGDEVTVNWNKPAKKVKLSHLNIIFEDEYLIVIEKAEGLLSVASLKEKKKTAIQILKDHMEKVDSKVKVHVVHRLEREVSGILIFAKTSEVQQKLQESWETYITDRKYMGVVEGKVKKEEDTLKNYLMSNKNNQVFVVDSPEGATETITHFKVVKQSNAFSMLEFTLESGFKNQIRVQMQHYGHPITGDKKYKARKNPLGRVALHASMIEMIHPVTGKKLKFELVAPANFRNLVAKG
ncbi:RluA family pseudouridine synthase [Marivirga sp. S37H4]|uniref:RluA family pseudouridine synthase n=1 Tax=Marivirga aurantiaca TaxID=2802615 RepID=A0A935C755_9BACT|nr:RluA family pseudouridine synthase [Marivirga aurantiaca]MBK6264729.1 RluA family pseudouridine synthase [Marivirga aurantiaca]